MPLFKNRQLLINVLIGLGLISFAFLSSPDLKEGLSITKIAPFRRALLSYVLLTIFFYVNYYLIIPLCYIPKKWVWFILSLFIAYSIIYFIPTLIIPLNPPMDLPIDTPGMRPPMEKPSLLNFRGDTYFFPFVLVFILSLVLRLNNFYETVKSEQLKTELSYLKAQINPHFLFNSLNSIYGLALRKSDETPKAVLKLSELMRYAVEDIDQEKIALNHEIKYIENYIELQKLRLSKQTRLDFKVSGDVANWSIATMLLIPFIENAFKYGVSTEVESVITMVFSMSEKGKFVFEIENANFKGQTKSVSTGIGLINTRKRLEHIYPNRHDLKILETPKTYKVILEIQLE